VVALFDTNRFPQQRNANAAAAARYRETALSTIFDALATHYYVPRKVSLRGSDWRDLVFVTEPGAGAAIFVPPPGAERVSPVKEGRSNIMSPPSGVSSAIISSTN
jgi:hypothetical protein